MVRVAGPRYDPERHGPEAGVNLAEALKELGRFGEAQAMVRKVQALGLSPFAERLAKLESEIAMSKPAQATAEPPSVGALKLPGPIWTRGFYDPQWLLPARDEAMPEVTFVVLANETATGETSRSEPANEAGRLTRAVPLYLSERFGFSHDLRTKSLVFVATGHGPVVFGVEPAFETVASLIEPSAGPQFVVTGSVVSDGVRLHVWDARSRERIGVANGQGSVEDLAALVDQLAREIEAVLATRGALTRAKAAAEFRPPPAELRTPYGSALEQLLFQILAANKQISADLLWNERGFYETYFGLVEHWTDAPLNARLIALCGVTAGAAYGSTAVAPYRKIALRWLDEAVPGSPLFKLAPAAFKRMGETERLRAWLDKAPKLADSRYAEWLAKVQAAE